MDVDKENLGIENIIDVISNKSNTLRKNEQINDSSQIATKGLLFLFTLSNKIFIFTILIFLNHLLVLSYLVSYIFIIIHDNTKFFNFDV